MTTSTDSTITRTILANGLDHGTFTAGDEAGVLDAYAREMGYVDFSALADTLEQTVEQCRSELVLLDPVEHMMEVIEAAGDFAHGGDVATTASAWIAAGFDADDAASWLRARCFDADAAARLMSAGIDAADAARESHEGIGEYSDTIGYKVANGDLTLDEAKAAIGGSTSISVLEVGPSSAVDVEGCVDATVRIGAALGTVTLVPNAASGEIEPYGDNLWMWAEPSLHAAIEADERMVDRVVAEVKAAL